MIFVDKDGNITKSGEETQLTTSELKAIGLQYELNGVRYQVPLDEDTQNLVAVLTTGYLAAAFSDTLSDTTIDTVMHLSNGVEIPITTNEWMPFAEWFKDERNKFFKKDGMNV